MLKKYLRPHLVTIVTNILLALILSGISAYLFAYIGTVAQFLMERGDDSPLSVQEIFGHRVASWIVAVMPSAEAMPFDRWRDVAIFVILLSLFRAALNTAHWYQSEVMGEKISLSVRHDLMAAFLGVNPRRRSQFTAEEGELSAALTQDVRVMREYIVHFYGGFFRELLQIIFYIGTLIILSPKLFLILVGGALPVVAVVQKLGKKIKRRANQALNDYSKLAEWLQQRLLGVETIKQFRAEEIETQNMEGMANTLYRGFYRAAKVKARVSPSIEALSVFIVAGVIYVTILDINAGQALGKDQFAFFTTLAMLAQSASKVGKYYNSNKEGHAAVDRLQSFFSTFAANKDEAPAWMHHKPLGDVALAVDQLTIGYADSKTAVGGVTFQVPRGCWFSVCGPSGSGKTTLLNSLLGLVTVRDGTIVWQEGLKVGFLAQHIHLLAGTVGENLCYPEETPDPERVRFALAKVGLLDFFEKAPHQLDTVLGRNGLSLSGGQEQRVLLARLFYHRFDVVCVDEGTSALDEATEQLITSGLRELVNQGATIIMVAHRLSALRASDLICGMRDGKIVFLQNAAQIKAETLTDLYQF